MECDKGTSRCLCLILNHYGGRVVRSFIVLAVVLVSFILGLSAAQAGSGEPTPKQLQAALNEVLSESKVVDAAWGEGAPGAVLYAGLKDDGTRRDGYAEYLCLVLADHGLRGGMVYVVDYRNFSRDARQRLGHAQCVK